MKLFFRPRTSVRARVLAIAFIPSVVLLVIGATVAGYLVNQGLDAREFGATARARAVPVSSLISAMQEERRLSMQQLARPDDRTLTEARRKTNQAERIVEQVTEERATEMPPSVQRDAATMADRFKQLPQFRQEIDGGARSAQQAYTHFNDIIAVFTSSVRGFAQAAPDATAGYEQLNAVPLLTAAEAMARSDSLAATRVASGGLTGEQFRLYVDQVGAYHAQLQDAALHMPLSIRQEYASLLDSEAWQTVTRVENTFLQNNQTELPVAEAEWREAAREVAGRLLGLYRAQIAEAAGLAIDAGQVTLVSSIIAGVLTLLIALAAFLVAVRLANRLVRRLARLRQETLDIANDQLPELVERVRTGQQVDEGVEVFFLDHGRDEIGQVAEAFNMAQRTAIAAAVEEAKTRQGTKTVFLNIAHRSQVIVHRQLKALDEAERKQEDPDQLDVLFKLDHLSTRARRNAENLIILGGEQPGRQWRHPVSLTEVVRGAAAETEDYARVTVTALPDIAVDGSAVADVVHLLAELIDNATSFSPPQSRVEIRGNVVGRGVVIEVEDQGLGIEAERCDDLNAMLANPPDFGIMALSSEPRLGLFVVARLAARHGITVTLRESAYGGIRAIVLVRSELLKPTSESEREPSAKGGAIPVQQGPQPRNNGELTAVTTPLLTASERGPSYPDDDFGTDWFWPRSGTLPEQPETPPRHELRPSHHEPPPQPPQPAVNGLSSPDRPPLPQRRRQQNLAPQLKDNGSAAEPAESRDDTPEQARDRLAAFQQGTRRAREDEPGGVNDTSGDRR
ncbi:MAG: HAMP domain-containing protein [Pseudonocardiaceae bacterium]|nr:HAMP domain-containing protein [Pseudonocardiaceae bacterium]